MADETQIQPETPVEPQGPPPIVRVEQYVQGNRSIHALTDVATGQVQYVAQGSVEEKILGRVCGKVYQVGIIATTVQEAFERMQIALDAAKPIVLEQLRKDVTRAELARSPAIADYRLKHGQAGGNGGRRRRL